ncbi:TPA_asm: hypothetical protein HUJ06_031860 [Nelumbo nucifera]|uniref:Uncharacterized protein n=1 Tax=Nelumbo nucifera TaxID=4432 RepID=A0A822ZWP9_NELNU|nr:TPA_asm: hypothetical protein HUJ06_031860 [Nelumbo nucifera]
MAHLHLGTALFGNFCNSCSVTRKGSQPPNFINILRSSPLNSSTIRCMANPQRVKMVAKQIRHELYDMLLTDKVLQYAVLPEAALGADCYLSSLTTISDVEVSADLQVTF